MKKYLILLFVPLLFSCATKSTYTKNIDSKVVKLCFIGDTGVNDPDQMKVAKLLEKEKCHSIHFVGDIIYENGLKNRHDKQFQEKFWNYYSSLTTKDHHPDLNMVLGNHDHKGSVEAWMELSKKYPKVFYPYPYYLLKINDDICLTHFDTEYFGVFANYFMAIEERNWLSDIHQDMKECKIKIAVTHHPYWGTNQGKSRNIRKHILKSHVIGKYDYFIAGHDHYLKDLGMEKGTRLLTSGAGGKHLDGYKNGFLVLSTDGTKTSYEFKALPK